MLYETESGSRCTLRWYDGPTVSVDQSGVQGVAGAALRDIAKRALDQWQATVCAGPTGLPAALPIQFGFGGLAVPTPVGATCTDAAVPCKKMVSNGNFVRAVRSPEVWPYGATVFALTVVTFDQCTGEIVDADIQLDDGGHQFCAGACGPGQQDLSNTLTHEVGHLLGLDHSVASESTMDSSGPSGQTKKATLHGDDRQGVCAAYTGGCGRNHVCAKVSGKAGAAAPPEPGSCAARPVASHLPAVGWILAALAMGAGVIRLAGRTRWPTSRRNPKFAPGYGP
ncbi:MAG: matrixin family metalloprotease [Deltaproteobacteria bacterium]|nr:matrixin family metalloprotease [Deltaproteobacteria bacterium]